MVMATENRGRYARTEENRARLQRAVREYWDKVASGQTVRPKPTEAQRKAHQAKCLAAAAEKRKLQDNGPTYGEGGLGYLDRGTYRSFEETVRRATNPNRYKFAPTQLHHNRCDRK